MTDVERLTVTLPADLTALVEGAVKSGDYASASEVVRAALGDWSLKRALERDELSLLRADIRVGLADIEAGRVKDFDAERILHCLSNKSSCVSPTT